MTPDGPDRDPPAPRASKPRKPGKMLVHALVLETLLSGAAIAADADGVGEGAPRVRDLYPLVTTPALFEARDYYVRHFGFEVAFEADWFVYLTGAGSAGARGATLAFMHPGHPSRPPGPEPFDGRGMVITIEVDDAEAMHRRLAAMGAPIVHPLTDEAWGQRRFMTRDPAGVLVDVVEQIAPQAGYWERYRAP